jgi:parallel beta-helix repeat protein
MATSRFHHAVAAVAVAVLLLTTVLSGTSSAAGRVVRCGAVITRSTTLAADVGPCPGGGIIVAGNDITVDLNGHEVSGNPKVRVSPDKAGVLLRDVSGVTLKNGTVEFFDAGVAIMGGTKNTVRRVKAQDNVNYRLVTGRDALPQDVDPKDGPFCDLGDGITISDSSRNVVKRNVLDGNGPYSGVSLVGRSSGNVVSHNRIRDNDLLNQPPSGVEGTICGGLAEIGPLGRWVQDVGVRIEGPGAQHNVVERNQIRRSALAGVMVTAFVIESGMNNGFNLIHKNSIAQTGLRTHELVGPSADGYRSSGIVLHNSGSSAVSVSYGNTISGNNSSHNFGAGIEVTGPFPGSGEVGKGGNTIVRNVANDNFLDGIHLAEGTVFTTVARNTAHRNGLDKALIAKVTGGDPYSVWDGVDGADNSVHCDHNHWSHNSFGTVNQECVATGGNRNRASGP